MTMKDEVRGAHFFLRISVCMLVLFEQQRSNLHVGHARMDIFLGAAFPFPQTKSSLPVIVSLTIVKSRDASRRLKTS